MPTYDGDASLRAGGYRVRLLTRIGPGSACSLALVPAPRARPRLP
jgi:hypothetical protein